jgi:FAD:protein FMN transferase
VSRVIFRSMGCDIVVEGASPARADEIRALFECYDDVFSRFRPQTELSRLNESRGGSMSTLFRDVLDAAIWASEQTGGLVDPRVGGAVVAAGYDRDFSEGLDSDEPAAAGVVAHGTLRRLGPVLRLGAGVQLDLNGVVKALAVDRAAGLLDGDGFVSAGGDLGTRGFVDVALSGGDAVRVNGGLATSGTTRRRWARGGQPQHHLIDPRTGRPAVSPWSEVTVCGATCLAADVAAKAALLLGSAGPAWLEQRGLPGRFVGDGIVTTAAWTHALEELPCI